MLDQVFESILHQGIQGHFSGDQLVCIDPFRHAYIPAPLRSHPHGPGWYTAPALLPAGCSYPPPASCRNAHDHDLSAWLADPDGLIQRLLCADALINHICQISIGPLCHISFQIHLRRINVGSAVLFDKLFPVISDAGYQNSSGACILCSKECRPDR